MSNSKLNDEIFDALLKEALSQLEEEKVKEKNRELEEIDTSDYLPSKKFLRNLRREYFRYLDYFYFPKYLPVDFQVVEENSEKERYFLRFKKDNLFFCISQTLILSNDRKRLDTEESRIIEHIEIDGHQGLYAEMDDKQVIYLNMGNIAISIYGNIGKQEILRMAKNLELLEK